ncbi:MAG TPA: rhodanese-like domain-containing protein [Kofleriaceae bacterium]
MVQAVTAAGLAELTSAQIVDLVDVRDPDEWQAGHIAGARLVPLERLRADPDAALARDVATVFICARGVRSLQAAKLAERFGYQRVYHLEGGVKEWARSGKALVAASRLAA